MSFRFTNRITGEIKQRILMDRRVRELSRRTFIGRCEGVVVKYSAYGRVLDIRVEKDMESRYYENPEAGGGGVRAEALSAAIRGAIWNANRLLRGAKEEAYRTTFQFNAELKKLNDFTMWFAEDGGSMRPHAYEALKEGEAGEWLQEVRARSTMVDIDRCNAPALDALENDAFVLKEFRREVAEEEQFFWRRVDLIRRSQSNSIKGEKRPYKNSPAPPENFEEKVQIKFAQ